MRYHQQGPETIEQRFELMRVDELKFFSKHVRVLFSSTRIIPGKLKTGKAIQKPPTRKADLVDWLSSCLRDPSFLRHLTEQLSDIEQQALQETVHSTEARFDAEKLRAKYGRCPATAGSYPSWRYAGRDSEPFSYLALFVDRSGRMPLDLQQRLQVFIPKPAEFRADYIGEPPDHVLNFGGREKVTLVRHLTEKAALNDLMAVLLLVDANKVGVGSKTGRISKAGSKALLAVLSHGDFYPQEMDIGDKWDVQLGPAGIRPFAWVMLLQAANLAQINGSKLALTRSGKQALKKPAHETLKRIWERWIKTKILHEFNRIELIKGQKSKGNPLLAAAPARDTIAYGLADLQEGRWIRTEDFFNFMTSIDLRYEICRKPWKLYLGDPHYGRLDGVSRKLLEGRFGRAFLLEYAATLGLIDVALVQPWGALGDHHDLWGADDCTCLSRYDGLWALRVNSLGSYILNETDDYEPIFHDEPSLQVLPNMEIMYVGSSPEPMDGLFLGRFCDTVSDNTWKISLPKTLDAAEHGLEVAEIVTFLEDRNRDPLPQPVRMFFVDAGQRSSQVRDVGEARLIACAVPAIAQLIANDTQLRDLCMLAGDRHLVVQADNFPRFRTALKKLGYGVKPHA